MPTQIENIKFYTVQEIAQALQVTPQTVRAYIKKGKIRAQSIGRPLLITESSLKDFLNNN
jgi:excisionase family DNA binding protein